MKKLLLPLLIAPALAGAQQTPPQQPVTQHDQGAPPPARNQTPPLMPNVVQIPAPQHIAIPTGPANEASRPLTADEAAKMALQVQPSLRLAQAQLLAAQGKVLVVRSGLLPTLSLSSTYGRTVVVENGKVSFPPAVSTTSASNGSSGVGTSESTTTGTFAGLTNTVTLHQLLFDFNHTRDLVRQAEAQQKAAKHNLTLAELNLIYAVKQAYYTYTQDQALVAVQKANLASTQAQLDLATAQVKTGLGAPANVVTAASAVGQASEALNLADQTATIGRINLALAIGVDPRTPIDTVAGEEPVPVITDMNGLVSLALKQRPDVLLAQESVRAAGFELSAARTTSAPSLSLSIGASAKGADTPVNSTQGALGLSISWDIFDGGLSAGARKEASADLMTAKSQLQTAGLTVVSDVTQAYVNLKTEEQQVIIAEASVKDAQEGVRLAEGRFRAGVAIFIEVTTAQATLVQAETALVNAQTSVQQCRALLRRAIGAQ
jgi:outer membrane protein